MIPAAPPNIQRRFLRLSLALGATFVAQTSFAQVEEPPAEPEATEAPAEEGAGVEAEASVGVDLAEEPALEAEGSAEAEAPKSEEEPTEDSEEMPVGEVPAAKDADSGPKFQDVWQGVNTDRNYFGWDGGFEMDVGYADYRFSTTSFPPEKFYDFRGQAWIAPVFRHKFGPDNKFYVGGTYELVAWLRDEPSEDKIRTFDAYAHVGYDRVASLTVGRVTTTRVYQPGNGFDIFTLEDTGAMINGPIEAGAFYPYTYELNHMWLRDTPGRGVLRLSPLRPFLPDAWNDLTLEFALQYGKKLNNNQFGHRGALVYDTPYVRLGVGYEDLTSQRAQQTIAADRTLCEKCWLREISGYGANVILRPPYIALGGNYFDTKAKDWGANGNGEVAGENERTTLGGFVELHTGHLLGSRKNGDAEKPWHADQRSEDIRKLTVGFGLNRTELVIGNGDFQQHTKRAIYIKYNLGFNRAFVKFVLSKADGLDDTDVSSDPDNPDIITKEADMLAGRLRFAYYF